MGLQLSTEQRQKARHTYEMIQKFEALVNLSTDLPFAQPTGHAADFPDFPQDPTTEQGKKVEIGQQEPFFALPTDFKRIEFPWYGSQLNSASFYAGTFIYHGRRVGYLRIPNYMPQVIYTMQLGLRYVISHLEAESDYLIFDQTYNPGGSVAFSDLVVESFTGSIVPASHMTFAVKPTPRFLRQYGELTQILEEDPETAKNPAKVKLLHDIKANYLKIESAFKNHADLSEPIAFYAVSEFLELNLDELAAHIPLRGLLSKIIGAPIFEKQTYTKPVFMLINEQDFSAGDATPAILQDYGRVKLVGVRTAGAGGSVEEFRNTITSDYTFHLTTSLMVRKGGRFVENYGVRPDIPFTLVPQDYVDGFANVLERLMPLLQDGRPASSLPEMN
jgi:hypothetical protein